MLPKRPGVSSTYVNGRRIVHHELQPRPEIATPPPPPTFFPLRPQLSPRRPTSSRRPTITAAAAEFDRAAQEARVVAKRHFSARQVRANCNHHEEKNNPPALRNFMRQLSGNPDRGEARQKGGDGRRRTSGEHNSQPQQPGDPQTCRDGGAELRLALAQLRSDVEDVVVNANSSRLFHMMQTTAAAAPSSAASSASSGTGEGAAEEGRPRQNDARVEDVSCIHKALADLSGVPVLQRRRMLHQHLRQRITEMEENPFDAARHNTYVKKILKWRNKKNFISPEVARPPPPAVTPRPSAPFASTSLGEHIVEVQRKKEALLMAHEAAMRELEAKLDQQHEDRRALTAEELQRRDTWKAAIIAVVIAPTTFERNRQKMLRNFVLKKKSGDLVALFHTKMMAVVLRRRRRRARRAATIAAAAAKLLVLRFHARRRQHAIFLIFAALRHCQRQKPTMFYLHRFYEKVAQCQRTVRSFIMKRRAQQLWALVRLHQCEAKEKGANKMSMMALPAPVSVQQRATSGHNRKGGAVVKQVDVQIGENGVLLNYTSNTLGKSDAWVAEKVSRLAAAHFPISFQIKLDAIGRHLRRKGELLAQRRHWFWKFQHKVEKALDGVGRRLLRCEVVERLLEDEPEERRRWLTSYPSSSVIMPLSEAARAIYAPLCKPAHIAALHDEFLKKKKCHGFLTLNQLFQTFDNCLRYDAAQSIQAESRYVASRGLASAAAFMEEIADVAEWNEKRAAAAAGHWLYRAAGLKHSGNAKSGSKAPGPADGTEATTAPPAVNSGSAAPSRSPMVAAVRAYVNAFPFNFPPPKTAATKSEK